MQMHRIDREKDSDELIKAIIYQSTYFDSKREKEWEEEIEIEKTMLLRERT